MSLPQYVSMFKDRHGKERYRFRRGKVTRYIEAHPGTAEFNHEVREIAKWLDIPRVPRANRVTGVNQNARKDAHGYVYFIGPESGPVKIGFAVDVERRRIAIQCGHPTKLIVHATMPGNRAIEQGMHSRFQAQHIRGEWFALNGDLAEFVSVLANPAKVSQS